MLRTLGQGNIGHKKVPGQKTNASVIRKRKRDLRSQNGGNSVVTVIPVIRSDAVSKLANKAVEGSLSFTQSRFTHHRCASRREIRQTVVVASLITIVTVHLAGNGFGFPEYEYFVKPEPRPFQTSPLC